MATAELGKSIALFDLDNTIYTGHSFFPVAKYLADQDLMPQGVWDDINNELQKHKKGEQTYSQAVEKLFMHLGHGLAGKEYTQVISKTREFFENTKDKFYDYFEQILPDLQRTHKIYLVTNNSQFVAEVVVAMFGLDGYLSTQMEIVDGKFTGNILSILADNKHLVEPLLTRYTGETIAVGDSEHDLGMLQKVKHPICFQPSPELMAEAEKSGWMIINSDTAVSKITSLLNSIN